MALFTSLSVSVDCPNITPTHKDTSAANESTACLFIEVPFELNALVKELAASKMRFA
jgi:hypothetical protein